MDIKVPSVLYTVTSGRKSRETQRGGERDSRIEKERDRHTEKERNRKTRKELE